MKPLILWGASGQAVVLEEFAGQLGFKIIALFDNDPEARSPIESVPVYTGMKGFLRWLDSQQYEKPAFVTAIGGRGGAIRQRISRELSEAGLEAVSLVHPTATLAANSQTGIGSQILMGATLAARTRIGDYCILNTRCSVDHECVLEDGVHIGPGATLAGLVSVGENAFIGAGATVLPRIRIGAGVVVGAGAVVTKDLPKGVVACGVPAKF